MDNGGEIWHVAGKGFLPGEANGRQLWIGEIDRHEQSLIQAAQRLRVRDVMRGDFALLNGDVDDFVRPGAIARRVNVRRAGLHEFIRNDAAHSVVTPAWSRPSDAVFGTRPSA
jgi:hypothetical protein